MNRAVTAAVALYSSLAPACNALRAAVSDDEADLIARKAVCDFLPEKFHGGEPQTPETLRAIRFGELEDRLLQFEARTAPRLIGKALDIPEPLYLYRITNEGTFILPQEKIGPRDWPTAEVAVFDATQEWIVAVSRRTGETFGLYGFAVTGDAEPTAAFNRLVARFHLDGIDQNTAGELAILLYRCVLDPAARNLMAGREQLRLRVEEYAYTKFDERPAERLFSAWWRGFSRSAKHGGVKIASRPVPGGFQVELPVFRVLPNHQVAPLKRTVSVSADGIRHLDPDVITFQYPMRDRRDKADY